MMNKGTLCISFVLISAFMNVYCLEYEGGSGRVEEERERAKEGTLASLAGL